MIEIKRLGGREKFVMQVKYVGGGGLILERKDENGVLQLNYFLMGGEENLERLTTSYAYTQMSGIWIKGLHGL